MTLLSAFLVSLFSLLLLTNAQSDAPTPTPAPGNNTSGGCSPGTTFSGLFQNPPGTWQINWTIDCDTSSFSAEIAAKAQGWVGFGLNTQAIMIGALVIQTCFKDGAPDHRAAVNSGYQGPTTIPNDVYRNVNAVQNDTHTIVTFTRDLAGVADASLAINPDGNTMLWSYNDGSDDFTQYHTDKAPVTINFYTGAAKTEKKTDYRLIHGSLMLLGWGFLAPAGTFVARFLKGIGHPWYLIHITIQYLVLALVVISFIIIENDLGSGSNNHFQHAHNVIGLTIVILTFIQVIFGILANSLFKPGRKGAPYFPDQIHWWLGRLTILYSFANIFVGMDQYGFTDRHIASPFIVFAVWLGVLIALFVVAEIVTGQTHHTGESGDSIFKAFRIPIVTYILMFVFGIILYAVTLNQMWVNKN